MYYNKNIQACTVNFKHQPPGDNDLEIVREVYENEIFNSLSIFYEKNRSNTALTSEQSSLLFIPKESLVDLG